MDEQVFQQRATAALERLFDTLGAAGDQYGFEADFNAGALTIEFETPPAKFVVSPNGPVRQIWVSANVRSYKLDWRDDRDTFVFPPTGQSLGELIAECIGTHLHRKVAL